MMSKAVLDIETTGINPITSRVTAVGILFLEDETPDICSMESEREILEWTKSKLGETSEIIGWAIATFDLPFLKIRGLKYDMNLYIDSSKVIDLARFFKFPVQIHSHELAYFLNLPVTETLGISMPQCYYNGNTDTIVKHCYQDLVMIKELYMKLTSLGLL